MISPARNTDNEALLSLAKRCPMEGVISAYTDRAPWFFTIYDALDDKYNLLVERRNNEVSACLGSVHRKLFINEEPHNIAFWGDLKVAPEYRKGLSAIMLLKEMIISEKDYGIKLAAASIIKGNKKSLIFTEGRAGIPKGCLLGDFSLFNVVPIFSLKPDSRYDISEACDYDIPEMVRFYNAYYKKYNFSPRFTRVDFINMLTKLPGLSIDKFLIARKNNKVEAIVACWDQQKVQKYIFLNYSFTIRFLRGLLYLIGLFSRIPAIPKKNHPLRFIYVCFVAVLEENVSALRAILGKINNEIRGSEYSHFSICLNEKDKLIKALDGMFSSKITSHLFLCSLDDRLPIEEYNLQGKLIHAEYALLI